MYLGNIISETPIKINNLFNIVNNIDDIENGIPSLIIGWDFVKRSIKNKKVNILNKNIDNNTAWTFNKKEKRHEYEKDLSNFVKNCISKAELRIKYNFVNILTIKYSTVKKIIELLNSHEISYIYISKNSFIYVYIGDSIYGFDFNAIDFLRINRKKIYKLLYSNKNKIFFNDDFIDEEIKYDVRERQKMIPYLYAIKYKNEY